MIELIVHPYKIQCDICNSKDTFTIRKSGIPVSQCPTICRQDLKEIVIEGIKLFGAEIELSTKEVAPADYEPLKAQVAKLEKELAASQAKVKKLQATPKPEPKGRKARTASSMKGGNKA